MPVAVRTMLGLFALLGRLSANLSTHQLNQIESLVECGKQFMKEKAHDFITSAHDDPVLVQRQGDGTWTKTQEKHTFKSENLDVKRAGGHGADFFIQRSVLQKKNTRGCILVDEPKVMYAGKDSWCSYDAMNSSFTNTRDHGHQGIAINFYCYDRAQYDAMLRIHESAHRKSCNDLATTLDDAVLENELVLKDWVVGRACCDHDGHNAVKWALEPLHQHNAQNTYDDLCIVVASIRNSFNTILDELPDWLQSVTRFVDEDYDRDEHYEYWTSLQHDPKVIEEILELELRFEGGHLKLRKNLEQEADWVDRVSAVLMASWRFRFFTASRWLTIGHSCKTLTIGFSSGLDSLVFSILDKPGTSKYYLNGFKRLTAQLKQFVICAAYTSYLPDAFLTQSLADDRVALHLDTMEQAVFDEFVYLTSIKDHVWSKLSGLCGYSATMLKHKVISGSFLGHGFLDWRVFREAKSLPWTLVRGDVRNNITELQASPEPPANQTARKIFLLSKFGNLDELVDAVELLGETSWSIRMSEQGHVAVTRTKRSHPDIQAKHLTARAAFKSIEQLFTPTATEKALMRSVAKLESLMKKNPNKIGGRQAYNKGLIDESTRQKKNGRTISDSFGMKVIAGSGKLWKDMSAERQAEFRKEARLLKEAKQQILDDNIDTVETTIRKLRVEVAAAASRQTGPANVSDFKLTLDEVNQVKHLFENDPKFKGQSLARLRDAAMAPPRVDETEKALIQAFEQRKSTKTMAKPWWAGPLSSNRHIFHDSIWKFSGGDNVAPRYYKFLFAYQTPIMTCFLALEPVARPKASLTIGDIDEEAMTSWVHSFRPSRPARFVLSTDDEFGLQSEVRVLLSSLFNSGTLIHSDDDWTDLYEVLGPDLGRNNTKVTSSSPPPGLNYKQLVKELPWLADILHKPMPKQTVTSHNSDKPPALAQGSDVEDDAADPSHEQTAAQDPVDIAGVYAELQLRRTALGDSRGADTKDFNVGLVGGKRSMEKLGVAVEAYKGSVTKGAEAERFCRLYNLQMNLVHT